MKPRILVFNALLLLIIVFGVYLRFYRLESRFPFAGEQGKELLQIKSYIEQGTIPLLGPATSHPWLSFGPLFYWIMIPVVKLFSFSPLALAYLTAFLSTLLILINYAVVSRFLGKLPALISSFLFAVSYSLVQIANSSRFYSLVPLFFYPFFFFFVKASGRDRKAFFWLAFWLGIMLNFHYTPLILIPPAVYLVYRTKKVTREILLNVFSGLLLTQIPFIIYNFKYGFEMITKFSAWIFYRVLVFLRIYPGKTDAVISTDTSLKSLSNFLLNSFSPPVAVYRIIFVVFLLAITFFVLGNRKSSKKSELVSLFIFLLFGVLAIFIHSSPPFHYYLPLYPIPILIISIYLGQILKIQRLKYFVYVFLFFALLFNLKFYFSMEWFYRPVNFIQGEYVPYDLQLRGTDAIIRDSKNMKYSLTRVGPNDQFEGDFAQNYVYLLWLRGNEPVNGQKLTYTIYEGTKPASGEVIYNYGGLSIVKNEYE